jgi:hypothetical protein
MAQRRREDPGAYAGMIAGTPATLQRFRLASPLPIANPIA